MPEKDKTPAVANAMAGEEEKPEAKEEETEEGEEIEEEGGTSSFSSGSDLMTAEGIIMLSAAGFIDILGFIFLILDIFAFSGEVLSWVSDIVASIFFGIWLINRSGKVPVTPRTAQLVQKVGKGSKTLSRWGKPLLMGFCEYVPVVGGLPLWTIMVFMELKGK